MRGNKLKKTIRSNSSIDPNKTMKNITNSSQPRNNWDIRNNSSNISAVLHPLVDLNSSFDDACLQEEEFQEEDNSLLLVSNPRERPKKPARYFCSDCYCQQEPIPPKLGLKPNLEDYEIYKPKRARKYWCNICTKCRNGQPHGVDSQYRDADKYGRNKSWNLLDYSPETGFLKRWKRRGNDLKGSSSSEVDFTTPREMYEETRRSPSFQERYIKELNDQEKKKLEDNLENDYFPDCGAQGGKEFQSQGFKTNEKSFSADQPVQTSQVTFHADVGVTKKPTRPRHSNKTQTVNFMPKNRSQTSTLSSTSFTSDFTPTTTSISDSDYDRRVSTNWEKINKLNAFRSENYFECHSTEDLLKEKPRPHKCVHKFFINERLIPVPLNPDSFGVSRCVICNQPMRDSVSRKEKEKEGLERELEIKDYVSGGNIACDMDLQQLNIGDYNRWVEFMLPSSVSVDLWKGSNYRVDVNYPVKIKRPVPGNSLALRFQKGVI